MANLCIMHIDSIYRRAYSECTLFYNLANAFATLQRRASVFKPNYRIRLYIGRNLMANAVVVADETETLVATEVRGGQQCKAATIDLCLLMAQAVMEPGPERDDIEAILAARGQGVPIEGRKRVSSTQQAQLGLEDDIPF